MKESASIKGYKITRYVFSKGESIGFKVRPSVPSIGVLVKGDVTTLTDFKNETTRQFRCKEVYTPDFPNKTTLIGNTECIYLCIRPEDYNKFTLKVSTVPSHETDLYVDDEGNVSITKPENLLVCLGKNLTVSDLTV
jgi:hypothetical protein